MASAPTTPNTAPMSTCSSNWIFWLTMSHLHPRPRRVLVCLPDPVSSTDPTKEEKAHFIHGNTPPGNGLDPLAPPSSMAILALPLFSKGRSGTISVIRPGPGQSQPRHKVLVIGQQFNWNVKSTRGRRLMEIVSGPWYLGILFRKPNATCSGRLGPDGSEAAEVRLALPVRHRSLRHRR